MDPIVESTPQDTRRPRTENLASKTLFDARHGRNRMSIVSHSAFKRSLKNILEHSDTDVFARSREFDLIRDNESAQEALIEVARKTCKDLGTFKGKLEASPPVNDSTIYPAGYSGYRWVTKIDPFWNLIYLAMAIEIAERSEPHRPDEDAQVVFSHRYETDTTNSQIFKSFGWKQFLDASIAESQEYNFVVHLDLADFYSRVYLHRVENEVMRLFPQSALPKLVNHLLMDFNTSRSFGIPVGGPASRILSEVVLSATDKFLLSHTDIKFKRYADDYRLFVDSIDEANEKIALLASLLFDTEGLSLQKSKTRIMSSRDFQTSLDLSGANHGSADHLLGISVHFDPYSATRDDDYENLKDALKDFNLLELLSAELQKGKADLAVVNKIIRALAAMPLEVQQKASLTMLRNTSNLYPVLPRMLKAIYSVVTAAQKNGEAEVVDEVVSAVRQATTDDPYVADSEINISFAARILGVQQSDENETALGNFYKKTFGPNPEPSALVRSEVIRIFGNWGLAYWWRSSKSRFATMHPRNQDAFIIASQSMGDEGQHWRKPVMRGLPQERLILTGNHK